MWFKAKLFYRRMQREQVEASERTYGRDTHDEQCMADCTTVNSECVLWTAEIQQSHIDAMPLCCVLSPVHRSVPPGCLYACRKITFHSSIMTLLPSMVHSKLMPKQPNQGVFEFRSRRLLEVRGMSRVIYKKAYWT